MQATDPVTVCLKMSPSSSGRNISFQTLCIVLAEVHNFGDATVEAQLHLLHVERPQNARRARRPHHNIDGAARSLSTSKIGHGNSSGEMDGLRHGQLIACVGEA